MTDPTPVPGDSPPLASDEVLAAPRDDDALAGRLADWRSRHPAPHEAGGDGRMDTLFIRALARQADTRQGAVRARLLARLAELIAAHDTAHEARTPPAAEAPAHTRPAAVPTVAAPRRAPRTALSGLVAQLEQMARPDTLPASADRPSATDEALASLGGPPDLKAMGYFRSTWSRLSAERRLTQSLARVPDKAGPLNAQHLVHQTLAAMRELSPGYLNHFLDYTDTLMWLERAQSARPAETAPARGAGKVGKAGKGGKAPAKKLIVKRSSRAK